MERGPLRIGKVYFSLFYADEKLRFPTIEALVYLGPDQIDADVGPVPGHLFQVASSFHSDGNWNDMTADQRGEFEEPPIFVFEEAHMDPIKDVEGLTAELRQWEARTK